MNSSIVTTESLRSGWWGTTGGAWGFTTPGSVLWQLGAGDEFVGEAVEAVVPAADVFRQLGTEEKFEGDSVLAGVLAVDVAEDGDGPIEDRVFVEAGGGGSFGVLMLSC